MTIEARSRRFSADQLERVARGLMNASPLCSLATVTPGGRAHMTMRRISCDDAGQPVEYGAYVYAAERYSFEMSVVSDSTT